MDTKKYMKAIDIAIAQLKIDEGCRLTAYPDPLTGGKPWTIGYGHTGGIHPGDKWTQQQANEFLYLDTLIAAREASELPIGFDSLNAVRQAVMINMTFNLGKSKMLGFKRTLLAIAMGDYNNAALYMLQSAWAGQVGQRAVRLAKQMKTGVK